MTDETMTDETTTAETATTATPRPRAEIAADIVTHAQEVHDAAHPYDNQNILIPTRIFNRLVLLVRELRGLPAEIADQE